MLVVASPIWQTTTSCCCCLTIARPAPVARGTCPPTIAYPPSRRLSQSKRCMEPPRPRETPPSRPKSSAITGQVEPQHCQEDREAWECGQIGVGENVLTALAQHAPPFGRGALHAESKEAQPGGRQKGAAEA